MSKEEEAFQVHQEDDRIEKMAEMNRRPIIQFQKNSNRTFSLVKNYSSVTEAVEVTKFHRNSISRAITSKLESHGFFWKYQNPPEVPETPETHGFTDLTPKGQKIRCVDTKTGITTVLIGRKKVVAFYEKLYGPKIINHVTLKGIHSKTEPFICKTKAACHLHFFQAE
jgi:hypothetical protein